MKSKQHLTHVVKLAALTVALGLASGHANAALQARYFDGSSSPSAYYDTDLNITWLADANYGATAGYGTISTVDYPGSGFFTWDQANTWASSLSFTANGNAISDWRLPTVSPIAGGAYNYVFAYDGSTDNGYNISAPGTANAGAKGSELAYLAYNELGIPSACAVGMSTTADSCDFQPGGVTNVGSTDPFFNIQNYFYWTGTANGDESNKAFSFDFRDGFQYAQQNKLEYGYAMAVANGDVGSATPIAAVPEADTWAMLLAGLGLVGMMARRRT
jgi:hypothetical protein